MSERIPVRIELTPQAKENIDQICEKTGMTQFAMLSRLVEWFANTDEWIKPAVLGLYPKEIAADIAKLILKKRGL